MNGLLLILRFRALGLWRAFKENAFVLLVLMPLVFGALIAVVDRFLPIVRPTIQGLLDDALPGPAPMTLVLAVVLTVIGLTGAAHELFPRGGRGLLLDLMPVAGLPRFVSAWLARLGTQIPFLAAILGLGWALARTETPVGAQVVISWAAHLFAAAVVLAGLEVAVVLLLVRFRGWRPLVILGGGGALAIFAMMPPTIVPAKLIPVVLAPWAMPAAAISRVLRQGAGVTAGYCPLASPGVAALSVIGMTVVACVLSMRWQRGLRQSALAQARGGPRRAGHILDRLLRRFPRRFPSAPRALLVRDLLLVLRRFSTAVDVAVLTAVGALVTAAMTTRLTLSPFWSSRVPLLLAAAAVLALVSIVPFVLRHQLPRAWIERSSGAEPAAIWRAKLWLSRLLAVVPFAIGSTLVLVFGAGDRTARFVDVLTLAAASWIIASLIGLASFEIAERPALGLVFGALVASVFASLLVLYRELALFWLFGYLVLASSVADRATHRVRFTEVAR